MRLLDPWLARFEARRAQLAEQPGPDDGFAPWRAGVLRALAETPVAFLRADFVAETDDIEITEAFTGLRPRSLDPDLCCVDQGVEALVGGLPPGVPLGEKRAWELPWLLEGLLGARRLTDALTPVEALPLGPEPRALGVFYPPGEAHPGGAAHLMLCWRRPDGAIGLDDAQGLAAIWDVRGNLALAWAL
ncbi:MAG: hypothetical protein H6739_20360 [Alphaproteobacteria bacterium]|nr:hypothetical protein [Alphaproteobacteria bacterium]